MARSCNFLQLFNRVLGICGSSHAHDINGQVVGTWYSAYDTHDNIAYGTLVQLDID